jgi:hypothetical protein
LNRSKFAILLFVVPWFMPAICAAAGNEICPWLNAATASGVLEGPVVVIVTHPGQNKDDASCKFTRREGSMVSELEIEVETMSDPAHDFAAYKARCGSDAAPLRAIGNEALVCSLHETFHGTKKQASEQVVSRVRERAFIVRVSSNAPAQTKIELRDKTQRVAEQVAGFLF